MAMREAARLSIPLLVVALGACTVLPIEEARRVREAQGGTFDAQRYAAGLWNAQTRQDLAMRAVPIEQLRVGNLDQHGVANGRRAGEGSPWTFVTQVTGIVQSAAIDRPRGAVMLAGPGGTVEVQTGPVVAGTAIRDALPSVTFDDFPDQIAFAEVGQALTDRALRDVRPALARLRPGDRVNILGVTSLSEAGAPIVLTPVTIETAAR